MIKNITGFIFIFFLISNFVFSQEKNWSDFPEEEIIGIIHKEGKTFVMTEDSLYESNQYFIANEILNDTLNLFIYPDEHQTEIDFWIFPFYYIYKNSPERVKLRRESN